jgi:hypothetical protein
MVLQDSCLNAYDAADERRREKTKSVLDID